MINASVSLSELLAVLVSHIDVPRSYYAKAAARHCSLGEWLQRKEYRYLSDGVVPVRLVV